MGETSPHTRGKRLFAWLVRDGLRNIPAYAGKTVQFSFDASSSEKHPRIRGENRDNACRDAGYRETSPHTRGKHSFFFRQALVERNIPAYAGKTHDEHARFSSDQKHPRIRGENNHRSRRIRSRLETSPHTRGKLPKLKSTDANRRNIPAYAGKTRCQQAGLG